MYQTTGVMLVGTTGGTTVEIDRRSPITKPITADRLVGYDENGQFWIGSPDALNPAKITYRTGHADVSGATCSICAHGWDLTGPAMADQCTWALLKEQVHETCLIRHTGFVERSRFGQILSKSGLRYTGLVPVHNGYYVIGYDPKRDPWSTKPWYETQILQRDGVERPVLSAEDLARVEALKKLGHIEDALVLTIGWRKRVIEIAMRASGHLQVPRWEEIAAEFANADVTKSFHPTFIELHAYDYDAMLDYLTRIATVGHLTQKTATT